MEVVQLPRSLHDITLEQWVKWNILYGKDLMAKAKECDDDSDKMLLFEIEFALKHYAHHSNTPTIDIDAMLVNDKEAVVEIVKEASLSQAMMFREMCDISNVDFKNAEFGFDGRKWHIVPPVNILAGKELTVAEFDKCQDIALIMSDFQDGNYLAIYELCEQYLQTVEGDIPASGSLKLLPLYIALCVKAYIIQTINLLNQLSHDRAAVTT